MSILLQFGIGAEVSFTTVVLFWVGVAICVLGFVFLLQRTDRIIKQREKANALAFAAPADKPVEDKKASSDDVHEEEAAAIALAIHLYQSQMHDMESFTITMQKVSRIYSPWSSKIYTLRQNPRYK